MGYAAVASLSHTIHLLLTYHQNSISHEFKDQIIALQKHAIFLESFIEDSPDRANNWEETIREVADRAEDIIELLLSDLLLESTAGSSKPKLGKERYELVYSFDMLERVTEEMESIAKRVKGRLTEAIDGSNDELMEIVSLLRGRPYGRETIAIVGMGGIGKTTLARNAYNNPLIMEHFDIRAWSTISQEYNWQQVSSDLLLSANKTNSGSVYMALYNKRYLIVLDDIWSVEAWNDIKHRLPYNAHGSRIILTTRSFDLAERAGSHVHEMRLLDEDTTWNILRRNIFKGDPCPSQLESVGKMISRSCRGHPLSIEVVSGILAADQTEAAWEDIAENIKINAASQDGGDPLSQILSLSYAYLPHYLKPCFLYFGMFQEGQEIRVSKLVKLWVAEGFLSESEFTSLEETGEVHVEDLVRRGLVSIVKKKCNGRIKSVRIHDLMQELCLRQARKDNFILNLGRFEHQPVAVELQSCRRVSTYNHGGDDFLEGVYGSTIRTIMLYLHDSLLRVRCSIGNARLLRILDLSNAHTYNYDMPEELFELFHLRYLAFHRLFSVSEAISNLHNLQTLIICPRENSGKFGMLPEGIWKIPQLRHLFLFRFELPSPKGALGDLQTLCSVVDFICSRENLIKIPNLKKLALFYTHNSRDVVEDYELHNLIYLQKLEILKIEMDWSLGKHHKMSCAFPSTLKKLNLCGLQLPWEDMKIVASLSNLQVLKLRKHAYIGTTWETSEGGFSQLAFLLIDESNFKNWITKSSHFPKLKCLVLRHCSRLNEVPYDIGKIPTLESIELDDKNRPLLRSAKWIEEDRQSFGYDPLYIRVV